jgi:hypothetical protein
MERRRIIDVRMQGEKIKTEEKKKQPARKELKAVR